MRRLALALSLGLALGLGACSSDSTAPNGSVVGVYQIQTVNGSHVPVTISGYTLTSDQYTLNNDGTYTEIATYSNSPNYIEHGQFSANGGAINFLPDDPTIGNYTGSVSGNVLTISVGGYVSVYQR